MPKDDMPEMPSLSLAKTGPKVGTRQWYTAVAREHGDTEPLKIEHRRERMSRHAIMLDKGIKTLQDAKKAVQVEGQREIDAYVKSVSSRPYTDETTATIERMKAELQSKVLNYEVLIYQLTGNLALVEGVCLIVDCLSLRMRRKKKSGKVGDYRYTACGYMHDLGSMVEDIMAATMKTPPLPEEDEDDIDEREMLDDEERQNIREGNG